MTDFARLPILSPTEVEELLEASDASRGVRGFEKLFDLGGAEDGETCEVGHWTMKVVR